MEIPSEMLYRNGIAMIAINAGIASVMSLKSILVTDVSIRNPTMIRAGAVAKDGIARKNRGVTAVIIRRGWLLSGK